MNNLKWLLFGTDEGITLSDWVWVIGPYVVLTTILLGTIWGIAN